MLLDIPENAVKLRQVANVAQSVEQFTRNE